MRTIYEACTPRKELLDGTFNPEIFTAGLSPVIKYYRSGESKIDSIYLDAKTFFTQGTFPTEGLIQTVNNVFRRIHGEASAPSVQRLETAFGGGKTHTLIACTHIAYQGHQLADEVRGIIDATYLPQPGEITVVGIAGDQLDLFRTIGETRIPHTLWGEIAHQIGGDELYARVKSEAESTSAPGETYFSTVLGNRKVLIMLDELAQYAARVEVAHPHGSDQLQAFMMSLIGYLRERTGMSLLVTLAGVGNAFARQTQYLAELLQNLTAKEWNADEAETLGARAVRGLTSVVWRDATVHTPVKANEISAVLSKRLFSHIDSYAAEEIAERYAEMYQKNRSSLPEEASRVEYRDRMVATYPFHPSFIDYLNNKLSSAENFQGTRGVLRVLALTVRGLWEKQQQVFLIHTQHINLRDNGIMNEVFNRTNSIDLLNVLNADIGSLDSAKLESGKSNAEILDRKNPHPDGIPFYEHTWKSVFLNSLIGREEGLASRLFGLTEAEALLTVSTPLTTPAQIRTALAAISEYAFYLRNENGKFYAHMDPTTNSVLARIRNTITMDQIQQAVQAAARKLVTTTDTTFHIEHNVSAPEDLPDNLEKPILGVVTVHAGKVNLMELITYKGGQIGRERQNLIFLLVPKTVHVERVSGQIGMMDETEAQADNKLVEVEDVTRAVLAIRQLKSNPRNYGISPNKLTEPEFKARSDEREMALNTTVSQLYDALYFPSVKGDLERKEIKVVSSEGGANILQTIKEVLIKDKELLTANNISMTDLDQLAHLFFSGGDVTKLEHIRRQFLCIRKWPALESLHALDVILRSGVEKGAWMIYKMGDPEKLSPTELYTQKKPIPLTVDLKQAGYSLVTPLGAQTRKWLEETVEVSPAKVRDVIYTVVNQLSAVRVAEIREKVEDALGHVNPDTVIDQVKDFVKNNQAYVYSGSVEQAEKPADLSSGITAQYHPFQPEAVIICPSSVVERNWSVEPTRSYHTSGKDSAGRLHGMLRNLASMYMKGQALSTIDELDLMGLEIGNSGARLRIQLENADKETLKNLGEFFQMIASMTKIGMESDLSLDIQKPIDACELIKVMRKQGN